jgi:hypothetical protein
MIAVPPRRQPQIQDWPTKFSSSTSHIENDAQSLSKSFPQCIDKDDHDISCLSEFYDAISPHSQQQEASADYLVVMALVSCRLTPYLSTYSARSLCDDLPILVT